MAGRKSGAGKAQGSEGADVDVRSALDQGCADLAGSAPEYETCEGASRSDTATSQPCEPKVGLVGAAGAGEDFDPDAAAMDTAQAQESPGQPCQGECAAQPGDGIAQGALVAGDPDEGAACACDGAGDMWDAPTDAECDGPDDAVAQAQESLGTCWQEGGRAVLTCPQDDIDDSDEDGDLGRFDIRDPHQLGELGEHIAARYLRMYDYKILERNYRCGQGEADIICTKDDSVVLVEVKTRLGAQARPEDAVDASKLRRYKRITLDYLASHEWFESVRLDVIAVNIVEEHRAQVHHFMGVCAWEG